MLYLVGILLIALLALTAWCFHLRSKQDTRLIKTQKALQEAKVKLHKIDEEHLQKETDRESTEERLRSYLQLLDALINTIPNPIYFKNEHGVFQGCNKVFAATILGLTRDRIIGRRPQDLPDQIPAELAATYQRQDMVMMDKGSHHTFEAQALCADGYRRDFLFSVAPIQGPKAGLIGTVAVLSDLTEKNRAAAVQMQKEKLEGVLETAGGVCHEFNQPLQALSGYLEILSAKLDPATDARTYLDKAAEQIDRMGGITAKLQGITHYETMQYADKTKIIDIDRSSRK